MFDSPAILLRKRIFRENNYLLTVFTQLEGKKTLLGRGMQKITSKLAAHCADFFIVTQLRWAHGRVFDTITGTTVEHQFEGIGSDLMRTGLACQVLEAVDHWTREAHPEPQLWQVLVTALTLIDTLPDARFVPPAFFMRALSVLGWHLSLDQCLHCRVPFTAGARVSVASGGGWCNRCQGNRPGTQISQNDLIVLRYLQLDQWGNSARVHQIQPLLSIIHESADLHRERPWSSDQWMGWVERTVYARA